ncbi:Golgin candidate [Thalictrum thalictroides]|uniref:Golgin candidate n=1 Tax=Thalictrum thalictroides TaxID=46969 RepID=A0A7J6WAK8_THATH|nr:Golgin candidate [Thalictrum thalictroides]
MEPDSQIIADKLWNILQVFVFMMKKGISKNKLIVDLHHLMVKRGKVVRKGIENLVLNNNTSFSCKPHDAHLSYISPREYEFSCSNTPAFRFHASSKHKRHHHKGQISTSSGIRRMFEMLNNEAIEASPLMVFPGIGKSPLVRQLRITDSPFPVGDCDVDSHVDKEAEEFIESEQNSNVLLVLDSDLLEVVDRRAKSVVTDLSEEQSNSKPLAPNGKDIQPSNTKPKKKDKLRRSRIDPPKIKENKEVKISIKAPGDDSLPDTDEGVLSSGKAGEMLSNESDQTSKMLQLELNQQGTTSEISEPNSLPEVVGVNASASEIEVPSTLNKVEAASPMNNEFGTEKTIDEHKESSALDSHATEVDSVDKDLPADADPNIKSENEDMSKNIDPVGSELANLEAQSNNDTSGKNTNTKEETPLASKKQEEPKPDTSSMKVQEQLDEAQGLLKSAITTGQSKEARLSRVCAGLSSRLQEYKSENAQLEKLLTEERDRRNTYESHIKQLQKDLSMSKLEVSRVESHMAEALAAKNSEIDALVNSLDTVKKHATTSEGKLASLQANMESMMRSRELTETRMMQALREELASVERRAEEERAAHNATKMAAMEREVELEQRAVDSSTSLARMQRAVDERASKVAELEQKLALLEAESASLNQELQDMEARARRGQKKSTDEANQALQMQAWQEEVDRARQGQRDAESKLSSLEAEMQKMRVEMAGMKRDAEHYSRQEHMELEKRYRELTDLLYHKQTQLETMASEKAATEFQLEKEVKRLQEAKVEAERSRAPRRASSSYWEEETDLKALEPLPLHHRHIAGASLQLQKAAKLLDSGAVTATRFLWRYPIARVILLFYMVFVHLFLMYLLHRLQEQADTYAAQEVAASMGLSNPNLP